MFKYDLVTPLAEKDVKRYLDLIEYKDKFLDINNFVVIGNDKVEKIIYEKRINKVKFINEKELVSFDDIKRCIEKRTSGDLKCLKRTGWYLQQFLKFSYSLLCQEEYYVLWDADTIPLHECKMMEDNKPVFDMKTEHHDPYFVTFSKLFPRLVIRNDRSYISEHMIIKTSIMREIIDDIQKTAIDGNRWYEKIINIIEIKDLPYSGFSDYETYGLYCLNKFPDLYKERTWDSLRYGGKYFRKEDLTEQTIKWLTKNYDAISFEAGHEIIEVYHNLFTNKIIQKFFTCKKLMKIFHQFNI